MTKKPEHSGLLVIDKPQGVTSHDVVAAVRGALHMKRVGHAGTLDPMATGVLVVGFGNATRLLNYIVDHNKTYEATIRLGQRTTTDDAEGELLPAGERAVNFPSRQAVEQLITERFTGRIEQHHHGEGLFLLGEFHHAANHRLMALMHAIERTDGHHGFLIVAQRRPIHHAAGIRRERDCLHHVLLVYEFVSVV